MKLLKPLSFGLTGVLVLFMVAATLLEKQYGTPWVVRYMYSSPFFIACWGGLALSAAAYLYCRKTYRQPFTFLLHLSFLVILAGALITHIFGQQGSVHLRQDADEPVREFTVQGKTRQFPFGLSLEKFSLEYYPGTSAPMDFVSDIVVKDGAETYGGRVSMNHIYRYRNYRFYQSRYDSDGKGTTLSVAYDPWGIAVTYTGYGLLLLSMCLFFFGKHSQFRQLLRHPLLRSAAVCTILLLSSSGCMQAKAAPRTLPRETAAKFGELYIYYNDRICPLQTLAKDFTVKLYGASSYKGLTAEQVLTGWFFYYDSWKEEPCVLVKSKEVQRLLGIGGKYARLVDFADINGYKLDEEVQNKIGMKDMRGFEEANEKFSLISMVAAGSIWKIYPYVSAGDSIHATPGGQIVWYSLTDRLPHEMPEDLWIFIRNSMNYVAEQVARGDFREVGLLLDKIRKYQVREAGDFLPSGFRFKAEKCYNRLNNSRPPAIISILLGIAAFVFYCRRMIAGKRASGRVHTLFLSLLGALSVYLCFMVTLRGIVSGHVPMSNGHETMQLLAACSALLALFFYRRISVAVSFGFLLSGLALLVSMLGESNPQVTQLMPVLSSPLLSFHVVVIMIAYSLLAFVMFNGLTAVLLYYFRKDCALEAERLHIISRIMLYPAVFLLAAGIFIGAVWANVSWGRYWGWDPKEVWALITMIVYAFALHPSSLPCFRRPMFFHIFSIIAFFSVLITYFGVNFLLGGMHSYA